MKFPVSVIPILFTLALFGQKTAYDPGRLYPPDSLIADLRFLQHKLESIHPGLYRYASKAAFSGLFDSLGSVITKPMTEQQFLSLLMLVQARIANGHTMFLPGEVSSFYNYTQGRFLPLEVHAIGGRLFVGQNYSPDNIERGSEILRVNDVAGTEVFRQLMARQVRDGYNLTYPEWILDHYFYSYYSFVFGRPAEFRLQLRGRNGVTTMMQVRAVTRDSIGFCKLRRYGQRDNLDTPIVFRELTGEKIAILTVRTFNSDLLAGRYRENYPTVINDMFHRLHRDRDSVLILDLRDNQGGDFSVPRLFLARLVSKPTQFLVSGPEAKLIQPAKETFSGRLIVLINGGSFSSTAILASILQRDHRAIFVGEETGGNATIISGDPEGVILPHTKLSCSISTRTYRIREGVNTGHGVMPDYPVETERGDWIAGKDKVMELAVRLAQQRP